MSKCVFIDDASENTISIEILDDTCWIDTYHVDQNEAQRFIMLLKHAFDNAKNKGCTKFVQIVNSYEWENFLSKNADWSVVENMLNNVVKILCDIEKAPLNIIRGFGISA